MFQFFSGQSSINFAYYQMMTFNFGKNKLFLLLSDCNRLAGRKSNKARRKNYLQKNTCIGTNCSSQHSYSTPSYFYNISIKDQGISIMYTGIRPVSVVGVLTTNIAELTSEYLACLLAVFIAITHSFMRSSWRIRIFARICKRYCKTSLINIRSFFTHFVLIYEGSACRVNIR